MYVQNQQTHQTNPLGASYRPVDWFEVAFTTISPKQSRSALWLSEAAQEYARFLMVRSQCHIQLFRGNGPRSNPHIHLIVKTHFKELGRWEAAMNGFDPYHNRGTAIEKIKEANKGRAKEDKIFKKILGCQIHYEPWKHHLAVNGWKYVNSHRFDSKFQALDRIFCPGKSRCKRKGCIYTVKA